MRYTLQLLINHGTEDDNNFIELLNEQFVMCFIPHLWMIGRVLALCVC